MNSHLSYAIAQTRQQDLYRAAEASRTAAEIQTSSWSWGFAHKLSAFRFGFGVSRPGASSLSPTSPALGAEPGKGC